MERKSELPPNRLQEIREGRSLKRYDLSVRLRVDPATIYRWETGESAIPDWAKLALSEFFEVAPAHLMGWEDGVAA